MHHSRAVHHHHRFGVIGLHASTNSAWKWVLTMILLGVVLLILLAFGTQALDHQVFGTSGPATYVPVDIASGT